MKHKITLAILSHNGEARISFSSLSFIAFNSCSQLPMPRKKGLQKSALDIINAQYFLRRYALFLPCF